MKKIKKAELERGASEELKCARDYVKSNHKALEESANRNQFHLMPEVGWMNDPNGFSVYKGEYHLFYQYYPYDVVWGPMHWGHAKSNDLIKWEYLPVALAPDQTYDADGCFSGSAIEVNGKHILMYTGHTNPDKDDESKVRQVQCLAIGDGVEYHKYKENPIIKTEQIPHDSNLSDFRDPKIWEKDGVYYCVLGSKTCDGDGQVLLYQSKDLVNWNYVGIVSRSGNKLGYMWECPDIFSLDGYDVLLMSPQGVKKEEYRHHNTNTTVYYIGSFDYETANFQMFSMDELDYGLDFYAPQTTQALDGRRIMVAWMQSWHQNIPTENLGWVSSMTIPRELNVIGEKLYQYPVRELENYRINGISYEEVEFKGELQLEEVYGRCLDLEIGVNLSSTPYFEIQFMKGMDQVSRLSYDVQREVLSIDRRESGSEIDGVNYREMPVSLIEGTLKLRLLIDTYSIEVFAQEGKYTMTSTIYSKIEADDIVFYSSDMANISVKKWDLKF